MPSQITTHILDTALGKPAEGVKISLQKADGTEIASGNTNADGRISNLLGDDDALEFVKKGDKINANDEIGIVFTNESSGKTILKFNIFNELKPENPATWLDN